MSGAFQVHKFGGASVKDADGFRNVMSIIQNHGRAPMFVVVSATGKSTNELENIADSAWNEKTDFDELVDAFFERHEFIMNELNFPTDLVDGMIRNAKSKFIQPINSISAYESYDRFYDQLIPLGEWMSSMILDHLLEINKIAHQWVDATQLIRTDDTYRSANLDWSETQCRVKAFVSNFSTPQIFVTQGFIGGEINDQFTTLGREGSDFTAAILGYCLNARSISIWKDVPGILTGDPTRFKHVEKIDRLSFREAIEMCYFGAKVIHPKTIKPLQNKGIPLHVKSFINPNDEGTLISALEEEAYPPIVVVEENQALVRIASRDFSFMAEDHLSQVFHLLSKYRIKVNIMRNTAISFVVCVQDAGKRLELLIDELDRDFKTEVQRDLEVLTIRHYRPEIIEKLLEGKIVLAEETGRRTKQFVLKPYQVMEAK